MAKNGMTIKIKRKKNKQTKNSLMHTSELSEVTFSLHVAFVCFSLGCLTEDIMQYSSSVPLKINSYLKISQP